MEIAHHLPAYTIEDILEKPYEWVVAVQERVALEKRNEMKTKAMLNRMNDTVLANYGEAGIPSEAPIPPSSVNQIQQIAGVRYKRA